MVQRILFVTPFAFKVSGADESLCATVSELHKLGLECYVLCPYQSPYLSKYIAAGAKVIESNISRVSRDMTGIKTLEFLLRLPQEILHIWRVIKKNKIQLVHINMESHFTSALAAKIARIPTIIHYRGKSNTDPKWFFDLYLPLLHFCADRIIGISNASVQGFKERSLTKKIVVMYNPLNLAGTQKGINESAVKLNELPSQFVLFAGRLDPQKRIIDVIIAMEQIWKTHADMHLVIAGGDMSIERERMYVVELKDKVKASSHPDKIHFVGHVQPILPIMKLASLLCMPAVDEGFGRVVAEAMSIGCPVAAAKSGAFPELIEPANEAMRGWLFEPCNATDLAKTVLEALEVSDGVRVLAARQFASSLSSDDYAKKLRDIYSDIA